MTDTKYNTGPNALRRGRWSVPGANYFVTVCLEPRASRLLPCIGQTLLAEAQVMTNEAVWTTRCFTVMPDHFHVLFTLGRTRTLSQCIARLKVRTQPLLAAQDASWQDNFYDHQLRPADSDETTLRYIWLNP
jgi:putative transposase